MQRHSQQGGIWRRAQPYRRATPRCQRTLHLHEIRKFRVVRDTDVGSSDKEPGDDARLQQRRGRALPVATGHRRMITAAPAFSGGEAASEATELAEPIRQLDSHRNLVSQAERGQLDTGLTLDAIIVPASRPANNLEQAITL